MDRAMFLATRESQGVSSDVAEEEWEERKGEEMITDEQVEAAAKMLCSQLGRKPEDAIAGSGWIRSDGASGYEASMTALDDAKPKVRAILEAALSTPKQVEGKVEPVSYRYRYVDPTSGKTVWRSSSELWNGQRPNATEALFSAFQLAAECEAREWAERELSEAVGLLRVVPDAMHQYFAAGSEERENGSARRQEKLMSAGEALIADIRALIARLSDHGGDRDRPWSITSETLNT